ncbi:NAD(P)/FAD-dependent oxidoreductase [Bacillus ndiopicus]|uniref:nitrite reductase n=1 Tax=Bacillus ndiopicus TaxID=1347368 RepID=UPI0005A9B894|nr:nitrite reductase [Bacillus ndiopicus]
MEENIKKVKIAINGGIGFGAKLNAKQLLTISKYIGEDEEIELTTFQQLYIEVPENQKVEIVQEFESVGLACYPVGNYVKSLRTCNFCKGEEQEGMPIAKEINRRIAGRPVPFTLRPAYTGCPVGCGEPLINDIGVMKMKNGYDLYIGGKAKGGDAKAGELFMEQLEPEQLYAIIEKVINIYAEEGKKREPFSKFCNRYGVDNLKHSIMGAEGILNGIY